VSEWPCADCGKDLRWTNNLRVGADWLHRSCWKARQQAEAVKQRAGATQRRAQAAAQHVAQTIDAAVRRRVELLASVKQLGNVTQACRQAGVTRDTYYRWKRLYDELGEAGLRPKPPRARLTPEIEAQVLRLTAKNPRWGKWRIARQMKGAISANGITAVWRRHSRTAARRTE
jgi:transposase-like protein